MTPPPAHSEQASQRHAECTSGRAAPVIDGLIAGYQVVRTVYATQASSGAYRDGPLSREADIALGVGFTGLFLASAIYGGVYTSQCRDFKERFQPPPPTSAAAPPTARPAAAPSPFTAVPRPGGSPP